MSGKGSAQSSRVLGQIRRLTFTSVCAILATSLLTAQTYAPLVAGLAAIAAGVLVLVIAPSWRRGLEVCGVGAVLTALAPVPAELLPGLWILLSALSYVLLYGAWHNRPSLALGIETRRSLEVDQPPQTAWRHLVPGASHASDYWPGTLLDFAPDKDDPDTLYARFRTADGLFEEATVTFVDKHKPTFCHYMIERCTDLGGDMVNQQVEVTLRLNGDQAGTTVEALIQEPELPPATALARWFDEADDNVDHTGYLVTTRRKLRLPSRSKGDKNAKAA